MLKFISLICSVFFSTWSLANTSLADTEVPTLHPAAEFNITDYRGQLVYLDFWASWCPPCRTSIPWLNRMQAKYRNQGFIVIGVNNDEDENDLRNFLQQVPMHFKLVADPQRVLAKRYRTTGLPYSLLIAPDGRILGTHYGFAKAQEPRLENVITRALHRYQAQLNAQP